MTSSTGSPSHRSKKPNQALLKKIDGYLEHLEDDVFNQHFRCVSKEDKIKLLEELTLKIKDTEFSLALKAALLNLKDLDSQTIPTFTSFLDNLTGEKKRFAKLHLLKTRGRCDGIGAIIFDDGMKKASLSSSANKKGPEAVLAQIVFKTMNFLRNIVRVPKILKTYEKIMPNTVRDTATPILTYKENLKMAYGMAMAEMEPLCQKQDLYKRILQYAPTIQAMFILAEPKFEEYHAVSKFC